MVASVLREATMRRALILVAVVAAVAILAFYLFRDPYRASEAIPARVEEGSAAVETSDGTGGERVPFAAADLMFTGSSALGEQPGFFEKVSGEIVLDEDGAPRRLSGTVRMDSVLTNADSLTAKLKNEPGMFEVARYPTAAFISTGIRPASGEAAVKGATHEVQGNLTLRGVTKLITFPVKIEIVPESVRLSGEFSVDRQWFGINYDGGAAFPEIRDLVLINLDVEAARTPSADSGTEKSSNPSIENDPATRSAD
jgi:polyisoprenoid-binding protein YceI